MDNKTKATVIEASYMKEFAITLDSNPTTGYSWVLLFDNKFLELRDRSFKMNSIRLESPGKEIFKFNPIKRSNTTLTMICKRTWEKHKIQKLNFEVRIH